MTANPLVSVVIPTYNHAHFLRTSLGSVVAQTLTNWEAIVVNNFSTDDTESVVASFNDDRIKLVNFQNNGVIAAGRNEGIRRSRGEFVAFLDSDDEWQAAKLERCVNALAGGADLVCHAEKWVGGDRPERIVEYGPADKSSWRGLLLGQNRISTSATVVRRSCLEQVDMFDESTEFITAEDYEMWMKLARLGCRFEFLTDVLGVYRRHESNASGSILRHLAAERAVVQKHLALDPTITNGQRRRRLAKCLYTAGRGFQAGGKRLRAASMLVRAAFGNPLHLRTYVALVLLLIPGRHS
jgi:glycosyltransferase involved in cell wall biosynthesis